MKASTNYFHLIVFLILFCVQNSLLNKFLQVKAQKNFDVGVILDNRTWIGNISWTSMTMAVEDFYAAHQNYTTRLILHQRDVDQYDSLAAVSAAVDLLQNAKVQAIIGPQSSTQAKFLIDLSNKIHVPVISFSAKSSLSSVQSPYFFQTSSNDSSQAKAIASIVQSFGWREVVPIFEDPEYGDGFVPYLIDVFRDIDVSVPYKSSIPVQATSDQMKIELSKLQNMQTRVFVVHLSYNLGYQFFTQAKEAGMMEEGYVWITTCGLIDLVDLFGSAAARVMEGTLGIKPYINELGKLQDFKIRWKKRFHWQNLDHKAIEPTIFSLWAYDIVWMLAFAAEGVDMSKFSLMQRNGSTDLGRLGISQIGKELHDRILNTTFVGITGNFSMSNGQLESNAFEIINVVGDGKRGIGLWTASDGISRISDAKHSRVIDAIWPGKPNGTPKGWEWPIKGKKLRIGIPVPPGFMQFVNVSRDPVTNKRGYCLEVFDAAMRNLSYNVAYEYIAYKDAHGEMNGTYDNLVYEVYLKNFDAVVGDMTIRANRSQYVDFTLPFTESGISIVVPIKDKHRKNAWTFLDPLSGSLWLASGIFFIVAGFVIWILEHDVKNNSREPPPCNQIDNAVYFSFSMLVFSHGEIVNFLTKIVVVLCLFVVLILQNSYTASLTSILTKEELEPIVTDLNDLIRNGYTLGYLNGSFMPGLLKSFNFDESKLVVLNSADEYNDALSNGTVAAIIDEIPYIKVFLSKYCKKYVMTGPVYKTAGFGFVFPKGSPLVPDISRAILNVTESKDMPDLEKILYGNSSCPILGVDSIASSSARLSINSFKGLFLIAGIASSIAVLVFIGCFLNQQREILKQNGLSMQGLSLLASEFMKEDPSYKKSRKTEGENGLVADENNAANPLPKSDDINAANLQAAEDDASSWLSFSTNEHENVAVDESNDSITEDEGTPSRQITNRFQSPPSFAYMVNELCTFEEDYISE